MKINAKLIFKIVAIACVPLTGYLAAKGTRKYDAEIQKLQEEKGDDITARDKTVTAVKSYGLAAGAGAAAIGSIIGMDHISAKELATAGGLIVAGKQKLDTEVRKYNAYRQATLNEVGEETESKIRQDAAGLFIRTADISGCASDETLHSFHLDWFDEDVFFDATMAEVLHGFSEINRQIFDYNSGKGLCRAYEFFNFINHPEMIDIFKSYKNNFEKYGWTIDELTNDCDCYWLAFYIVPHEVYENTYEIKTVWYPNRDIDAYISKMKEEGVI